MTACFIWATLFVLVIGCAMLAPEETIKPTADIPATLEAAVARTELALTPKTPTDDEIRSRYADDEAQDNARRAIAAGHTLDQLDDIGGVREEFWRSTRILPIPEHIATAVVGDHNVEWEQQAHSHVTEWSATWKDFEFNVTIPVPTSGPDDKLGFNQCQANIDGPSFHWSDYFWLCEDEVFLGLYSMMNLYLERTAGSENADMLLVSDEYHDLTHRPCLPDKIPEPQFTVSVPWDSTLAWQRNACGWAATTIIEGVETELWVSYDRKPHPGWPGNDCVYGITRYSPDDTKDISFRGPSNCSGIFDDLVNLAVETK